VLAGLTHRWQPLGVAVVGMLLTLPALRVGLIGDDYYQRAVLHGSRTMGDIVPPAWEMFSFFDGNPQADTALDRTAAFRHGGRTWGSKPRSGGR